MRIRIFGLALLAPICAGSAFAADLPSYKARVAAAPAWNWTGCYVGVNVGAQAARSTDRATTGSYINGDNVNYPNGFPGGTANASTSGGAAIGGGQIGCRYETPQHFVFGLEGDFGLSSFRQTSALNGANLTAPFLPGDTFTTRIDWQSSIRGNLGYSWDRWLAYVTGGVAIASVRKDGTYVAGNGGGPVTFLASTGSETRTLVGLTIGAGAAYAIDNHWTIGAEYRYTNYDSKNFKLGTISSNETDPMMQAVLGPKNRGNLQTHEFMAKLNYGFDWFKSSLNSSPLQAYAAMGPAPDTSRFYSSAEYLLYDVKGAPLSVPLVSTGPIDGTHHGLLGAPATGSLSTILYGAPLAPAQGGNDTQNLSLFSGARLTAGYWLDDAKRVAIEASGFALEKRSAGYASRSDSDGNPITGFPVYNSVPYSIGPMTIFAGEDSLPTSLPDMLHRARSNGIITGGLSINNSLKLWGADVSGVFNLYRSSSWELSGIAGFRYLHLDEELALDADIQGITGQAAGQSGTVFDRFQTSNNFYGGMFGLRGKYFWGRFSADLTTSLALGVNRQVINIDGGFTDVNFSSGTGKEGVFAMPSNEGRYGSNKFAYVPEVRAKLGYDLTSAITLTVGYDFLYFSNVVRPGDQINREIPKGQTFQQAMAPDSTTSPSRLYNTTDFYAHGLTVGLTAKF